MNQIDTLYRWHQTQIGTTEEPKGSNNVIYNTLYYNRIINDTRYHWCLVYIWAGFHENGMDDLFYNGGKTASCTTFMNWAKSVNQWITNGYKLGDIVFFNFDDNPRDVEHVGFYVDALSNGKIHTIEGNTNDKVAHVYRDVATVAGAYRPKYDAAPISIPVPVTPLPNVPVINKATVSLPVLQQGDKGSAVKTLQTLLIANGCNVGPDGADGDFGPNTKLGVREFQGDKGIMVDGICGPETHAAFWGV